MDDAAVVQIYVDGFEQLPLRDKVLVYHLAQAAIAGRDIFIDQKYKHSLDIRDLIEELLTHCEEIEPGVLAKSAPTPNSFGSTTVRTTPSRVRSRFSPAPSMNCAGSPGSGSEGRPLAHTGWRIHR